MPEAALFIQYVLKKEQDMHLKISIPLIMAENIHFVVYNQQIMDPANIT